MRRTIRLAVPVAAMLAVIPAARAAEQSPLPAASAPQGENAVPFRMVQPPDLRLPASEDVVFESKALGGKQMRYRVLKPAQTGPGSRRYPVLYLLHGYSGDFADWESRTHLREHLAGLGLIVVMPEGENSWYTNAASEPVLRFEDYITRDLVADVESRLPAIRSRHGRAIAGLSMGGFGAVKLALKSPQTWAVAASPSGAFLRDFEARTPGSTGTATSGGCWVWFATDCT